jgi:hypothetical protein
MSVRVTVPNLNKVMHQATKNADEITRQRFIEEGLNIGEEFVQMCTKYVPWKTGALAGSGHAYLEGDRIRVSWSKKKGQWDIAWLQYNLDYKHEDKNRGPEWDKRMLDINGEVFRKKVQDLLNGK